MELPILSRSPQSLPSLMWNSLSHKPLSLLYSFIFHVEKERYGSVFLFLGYLSVLGTRGSVDKSRQPCASSPPFPLPHARCQEVGRCNLLTLVFSEALFSYEASSLINQHLEGLGETLFCVRLLATQCIDIKSLEPASLPVLQQHRKTGLTIS